MPILVAARQPGAANTNTGLAKEGLHPTATTQLGIVRISACGGRVIVGLSWLSGGNSGTVGIYRWLSGGNSGNRELSPWLGSGSGGSDGLSHWLGSTGGWIVGLSHWLGSGNGGSDGLSHRLGST